MALRDLDGCSEETAQEVESAIEDINKKSKEDYNSAFVGGMSQRGFKVMLQIATTSLNEMFSSSAGSAKTCAAVSSALKLIQNAKISPTCSASDIKECRESLKVALACVLEDKFETKRAVNDFVGLCKAATDTSVEISRKLCSGLACLVGQLKQGDTAQNQKCLDSLHLDGNRLKCLNMSVLFESQVVLQTFQEKKPVVVQYVSTAKAERGAALAAVNLAEHLAQAVDAFLKEGDLETKLAEIVEAYHGADVCFAELSDACSPEAWIDVLHRAMSQLKEKFNVQDKARPMLAMTLQMIEDRSSLQAAVFALFAIGRFVV